MQIKTRLMPDQSPLCRVLVFQNHFCRLTKRWQLNRNCHTVFFHNVAGFSRFPKPPAPVYRRNRTNCLLLTRNLLGAKPKTAIFHYQPSALVRAIIFAQGWWQQIHHKQTIAAFPTCGDLVLTGETPAAKQKRVHFHVFAPS